MNLLESYKGRLAISEKYYAAQNGTKMNNAQKLVTAMCLDNTQKFLNEAFEASVGTQRSDLGKFKVFCMDITTLTVPNLIVNNLFMVQPMPSFTGSLTYMQYALGNEKNGLGGRDAQGNLKSIIINENIGEFKAMTKDRMNYTGDAVVEAVTIPDGSSTVTFKPAFTPVVKGTFYDASSSAYKDVKFIAADGTVTYYNLGSDGSVTLSASGKVAYRYDNIIIPQAPEKIPSLVGHMTNIGLEARARRIKVEYSQIAAYQAKKDYGMDFESTIAEQAKAELEFETDSEAVDLIREAGDRADGARLVEWTDEELDTIGYSLKAEGFARAIERAKIGVYKATNRFMPNWMLVSPEVMPILTFVKGFKAASNVNANGPYVAGEVDGLKVIVSPTLTPTEDGVEGVCYLGVLGADGKTAVGVYAPYMPLVPTQLLGFADGTMSQGFSSLYDMKILNEHLLSKIVVKLGDGAADVAVTAMPEETEETI